MFAFLIIDVNFSIRLLDSILIAIIYIIIFVISIPIYLSLLISRFHDVELSAWVVIILISIGALNKLIFLTTNNAVITLIIILIICAIPSQQKANKYGNPL